MNSLAIFLGIYLIILFALVLIFRDKNNKEDFLISGRNRSTWQIMLSKVATTIGVGWFIAYTAYAYEFGIGMFGLIAGAIVGFLLFAYWAVPRIYKFSREQKFYTQGDYVEYSTNSRLARSISDYISIGIYFLGILIAFVGGGKIISHFGLMSYDFAVILTALIILVYVLISGYRSIILTDIIQSIVIMGLLIFVSFSVMGDMSVVDIIKTESLSLSFGDLIGFLIYGTLAVFSASDRYLLSFAAKDSKSAKHGMGLIVIPIILIAILLMLVGLFVRMNNTEIDPSLVFVYAMENFLSPTMLSVAVVLFFAGLMSTADTAVYVIASQYTFLKKSLNPVKMIRRMVIGTIMLATILSLIFTDIVEITVFLAIFSIVQSVAYVYLISGGKNKYKFISSSIFGLLSLVLGIIFMGMVPALVAIVAVGSLIGLIIPTKFIKLIPKVI